MRSRVKGVAQKAVDLRLVESLVDLDRWVKRTEGEGELTRPFQDALDRAESLRRAARVAHHLQSTATSFGEALWVWLSDTVGDPPPFLPRNIDAAQLRAGELRAADLRPEELAFICLSSKLDPMAFLALVAQDLEHQLKESIELETFRSREHLASTIRGHLHLMQELQEILGAPATGTPAPATEDCSAAKPREVGSEWTDYEPVVRRWAEAFRPQTFSIEDLVWRTLMAAEEHLAAIPRREPGDVLLYLRTIFMNTVARELRRFQHPTPDEADALPDSDPGIRSAVSPKDREDYERALAALPPRMRRALVLRMELGLSYQEVAEATGSASANAVRMTISRALARMGKS